MKASLEVLTFKVKQKSDEENVILSNLDNIDLVDNLFRNFVKSLDSFPGNIKNKNLTQVKKADDTNSYFRKVKNNRYVSGILSTGSYGKEDIVVNKNKKDKPAYTISTDDAVLKPFFFMICVPKNKDVGFIILERQGVNGIKGIFMQIFNHYFRTNFANHKPIISNYIDKTIAEEYILNGSYNSIKLVRKSLSADIAERIGLEPYDADKYTIELKISAPKGKGHFGRSKKRAKELFDRTSKSFFTDEPLNELGFNDEAKVFVSSTVNGYKRSINLSDTNKVRPYYDIQVESDTTKYSEYNSIESETIKLIESLDIITN